MNRRRILYYALNLVGVVIAFGVISAIYTFSHNDMRKFYISLGIAVVAVVLFIILYFAYNFADRNLKQLWFKLLICNPDKTPDYAKDLEITKNNFDSDTNSQKNKIVKPNFRGAKQLCDFSVLKKGTMCYGCVVEANTKIFVVSKFVHQVFPAVIIYSLDEYYINNPMELKEIANELYKNKNNNFLRNEYTYFFHKSVDEKLTKGRKVYATTMLLYRYHLPLGGLPSEHLVLPVIVNPESCNSIFAVDCRYWSENIVGQFLREVKGRANIITDITDIEVSNEKVNDIFGIEDNAVNVAEYSLNNQSVNEEKESSGQDSLIDKETCQDNESSNSEIL